MKKIPDTGFEKSKPEYKSSRVTICSRRNCILCHTKVLFQNESRKLCFRWEIKNPT